MKNNAIEFLESHKSKRPSRFLERVQWRKDNADWLRWSREVSLSIIEYMQRENLTRADIAERLEVSPQYVSRILSGKENFSFKSIDNIQKRLGIKCQFQGKMEDSLMSVAV